MHASLQMILFAHRKNIPHWLQDVDTGYLTKVELEDKVSSIQDDFNFYRAFYDSVSSCLFLKLKIHLLYKKNQWGWKVDRQTDYFINVFRRFRQGN